VEKHPVETTITNDPLQIHQEQQTCEDYTDQKSIKSAPLLTIPNIESQCEQGEKEACEHTRVLIWRIRQQVVWYYGQRCRRWKWKNLVGISSWD